MKSKGNSDEKWHNYIDIGFVFDTTFLCYYFKRFIFGGGGGGVEKNKQKFHWCGGGELKQQY